MVNGSITYTVIFREALSLSRRTGTWVIDRIRTTEDLEHMIWYLQGRLVDFENRKACYTGDDRRKMSERIGSWRRAIRFTMRLQGQDHQSIACRILSDITGDDAYLDIRFIASSEIDSSHTGSWKIRAKPRRRPGRPKIHHVRRADLIACSGCLGAGFIPKNRKVVVDG